uniref:SCP domain-containing protein n=1 Tax=Gadus morhua TaxID=8049 RepID=A0A8C5AS14_GADMO
MPGLNFSPSPPLLPTTPVSKPNTKARYFLLLSIPSSHPGSHTQTHKHTNTHTGIRPDSNTKHQNTPLKQWAIIGSVTRDKTETLGDPCSTLTCWFPLQAHFTQVVWKETTEVGVGLATDGKRVFVVAQYRPAGNIEASFE